MFDTTKLEEADSILEPEPPKPSPSTIGRCPDCGGAMIFWDSKKKCIRCGKE